MNQEWSVAGSFVHDLARRPVMIYVSVNVFLRLRRAEQNARVVKRLVEVGVWLTGMYCYS